MTQPTPYQRQFNFTGWSSSSPNRPQPGVSLDADFNAIRLTLSQVLANLALIQRDDTRLANGSVGVDQLDGTALAIIGQGGFTVRGDWTPFTPYVRGDVVSADGLVYLVVTPHTSNAILAVDLAADLLVTIFNPNAIPEPGTATLADGDYGDIDATLAGTQLTIGDGVVGNSKLAQVAPATIKGRVTSGVGPVEDLSGSAVTALLNTFTDFTRGIVPASGGGVTNFLRADGSWSQPGEVSLSAPGYMSVADKTKLNGITPGAVDGAGARAAVYTGGTMTGPLILAGDATSALGAATKQQVDAIAAGFLNKFSVSLATTANIVLSGEQTIDGVLTSGTRVLVKNQTLPAQNGIYVSAAGAWARAADMNVWGEAYGAGVFVTAGSTLAATGWSGTSVTGGTIDTTPITFVQQSASITYSASTGLALGGNAFSLSGQALSLHNLGGAGLFTRDSGGVISLTTMTAAGQALLDDADNAAQRTTLGLGTSATVNTGTSGATIPLLNGSNTWANTQTYVAAPLAPSFLAQGTFPAFKLIDNDSAVNARQVLLAQNADRFSLFAVNDANTIFNEAIGVTRSGATPTGVYTSPALFEAGSRVWTDATGNAKVAAAQFTMANGVSAIARALQDRQKDYVSVMDYIPIALHAGIRDRTISTATDLSAYIALALTEEAAVEFPPGLYPWNTSRTVYRAVLSIKGAGEGVVDIRVGFAAGDVLTIGSAGPGVASYINVEGLLFTAGVARTSGAFLKPRFVYASRFQNLAFAGGADGLYLDTAINVAVDRIQIISPIAITNGVVIDGGRDHYITKVYGEGTSSVKGNKLIDIRFTAASWITQVGGIYFDVAVDLRPTAPGAHIDWFFGSQIAGDLCTTAGIRIDCANAERIKGVTLLDSWGSSSGIGTVITTSGIGTVDGVTMIGQRGFSNQNEAVRVVPGVGSVKNIDLIAHKIAGNSQASLGTYDGIYVGPGVQGFRCIAGSAGNYGDFTPTQRYGLYLAAGATDLIIVALNDFTNNATGSVFDGATGTTKRFSCNAGFNDRYSGTATLLSGQTSVNVNHSLGGVANRVQITWTSIPPAEAYVNGKDATKFTVNTTSAPVGNRTFDWEAHIYEV